MRPRTYSEPRCQLLAESPRRGVLCTRCTGYATVRCVEQLMLSFEDVDQESPSERIEAFHDWEGVTGYAAGTLERYTSWSKAHRHRVKKVHVLVASRMVVMAIAVARLALPYLFGYNSRVEFEKARRECIEGKATTAAAL